MAYQAPALGIIPPAGREELRRHWGWFVAVGLVLMALGLIAGAYAVFTTSVSVVVLGAVLIVAGAFAGAQAFGETRWGGFFIELFTAVLYIGAGFLMVVNPLASAVGLTLFIAMFLIVSGLFRAIAAIAGRPPHWGWLLFHGVVSLILGILIWQQWPVSGIWVIGLFIGIEVLINGVTLLTLGLMARNLPPAESAEAGAGTGSPA